MYREKLAAIATKTDPAKWEQAKKDAKARMGGKHSARAMQLATQLYKKRGGGYSDSKPTTKNNSLKKWTAQKWQWSGGNKEKTAGRGVYLPKRKIDWLKSTKEGRKRLSSAASKKAKATRQGRQYSSHGLAAGTSLKKRVVRRMKEKKASMGKLAGHLPRAYGMDDDAYMLCKVLDSMAAQALALKKKIKMGKKLPSWAEYKVYKASDSIKSALSSTHSMSDHMPRVSIRVQSMSPGHMALSKTAAKTQTAAEKLEEIAEELFGASRKHKRQGKRVKVIAKMLKTASARDPRLERAGVSGYNKPKRTPNHPTKSHIVVAKEGDSVKTIRFGQQGVKTNQTAGQRRAFKSRHAKNISRGKMSAAYWADKVKWSPSKTKDKDNQKWVKGS